VETPEAGANMENIAAVLGDFIGGITLTGSDLEPGLLYIWIPQSGILRKSSETLEDINM